jgi:hypothetical protein
MPGLGRIQRTDFRDHNFLAAALIPDALPARTYRRWYVPPAWDQGDTPQCVAFAALMLLNAGPVRNVDLGEADTAEFYAAAQAEDGDPLPHDGSTVRAAMTVLRDRGYITEYRWAFTVPDIVNWILRTGPVDFGTVWLNSMFNTRTFRGDEFVDFNENTSEAGGHSYLAFGVNMNKTCPDGSRGAFEIQNSWGRVVWGRSGRAWLPFTAAAALMSAAGECACVNEIIRRAA